MTEGEEFLGSLQVEPVPQGFQADGFDCEEEDLTAYICDGRSASDEQAGISRSYCVHSGDQLVGYFTVLADSIQLKGRERPEGVNYPTLPAVKIGRMGVDAPYQHRGVGQWILSYVVGLARDFSQRIGIRYVTLDALKEEGLITWYESYGFVRNEGEPERKMALLKFYHRWKAGDELDTVSMRFDILLQDESGPGPALL